MLAINSIKSGIVIEGKFKPQFPEKVQDIIKCKNPRCITSIEYHIPHRFYLVDKQKGEYRCEYCDEAYLEER